MNNWSFGQPLKLGVSFPLDSKDVREEPRPKVNIDSGPFGVIKSSAKWAEEDDE
jgi:hypothetical protein